MDEAITLHGYSIEEAEISAGRPLQLQLFWLTSQPLSEKYKVFVHVIDIQDFHKVAQRDGEPACGRYDTDTWRVGDVIVDRYYLPTTTESRPGEYTVLVGMYDAETHDLLPVFDASENHIGDSIQLHTVTVDEP